MKFQHTHNGAEAETEITASDLHVVGGQQRATVKSVGPLGTFEVVVHLDYDDYEGETAVADDFAREYARRQGVGG